MSATLVTVLCGAMLLGAVAGALGCFAVLKRHSLLGDALAHAALPGVCLAYMFGLTAGLDPRHPLLLFGGALATAWLGTVMIMGIARTTRLKYDAAIGIVLSVFFGAGIVLLTYLQKNGGAQQAGLDKFLFGQAAALSRGDVWTMAVFGAIVLGVVVLCFRPFKLVVFNAEHAGSLGLPVRRYELLLVTLIVVAVVLGLRTVGVVLIAALLVTPAAAARQWTEKLSVMVLLAALFGMAAGGLGAYLSAQSARMPTGPLIVLSATALLLVSLLLSPRRGLLWAWVRRRRNRERVRIENLLKDMWRLGEMDQRYTAPRAVSDVLAVRGAALRAIREARESRFLTQEGTQVRLTERGLERAARIVRNHRIWELYLSNRLDLADDHLHRDAEDMEHALDDEVLEQIDEALGRPAQDPHGRPIPRGVPA
ncbi:MAG: iron chelate uptake ABC transporter family permease subunit [Planctomycetota bacterium]